MYGSRAYNNILISSFATSFHGLYYLNAKNHEASCHHELLAGTCMAASSNKKIMKVACAHMELFIL